jgi:Tfp pilus assembly protein PilO
MSLSLSVRLPSDGFLRSRGSVRSPWRARAGVFLVLGLLLLANAVVLVTYRIFYDARFHALSETRDELTKRRDAARNATTKVLETERRLAELQKDLEVFHKDVLGARKERLAALIENVYALTGKAGFSPSQIGFAEDAVPGAERLSLSFSIQGTYKDVKKLLHAFESDPGFLVLEQVGVGTDDNQPDVLRIALSVAHYFRSDVPSAPRRARVPVRAAASGPAAEPSAGRAPSGVPE